MAAQKPRKTVPQPRVRMSAFDEEQCQEFIERIQQRAWEMSGRVGTRPRSERPSAASQVNQKNS